MKLLLERFCYSETETEGRLWLDGETSFYTLERPWVGGVPGGVPFRSCVPDGTYDLVEHTRPNGDVVFALRNPHLHVYYDEADRGDQPGRYLILMHAGNYVEDVVGCIAPGIDRTIYKNRRMVTSSRKAMAKILSTPWESIEIRPSVGTGEWE